MSSLPDLPRGFCLPSDKDGLDESTPIELVVSENYEAWFAQQSESDREWLRRQNFAGKAGQSAWLEKDSTSQVIACWDGKPGPGSIGGLPATLPEGKYHLTETVDEQLLIGWGLGAYQFTRYKDAERDPAELALNEDQATRVANIVTGVSLGRDLINTPAADMAPSHLMAEISALADQFGATCEVTTGEALLDRECGAIHAVGRAAEDEPSLAELSWGDAKHPLITIIGKGVTFDSGGLDLKPASGMRMMKKDMGGAAIAIGLAYTIMAENLPVQLKLIIPAAENAVAGNAFRPGDILHTHAGLTVEIDNTDAEGRLLLCDALSIAQADKPELIVDFATLTGSARSAVGTEISAMFSSSDEVARDMSEAGESVGDTVWRMPLHEGYKHMLESNVADLVNSAASPYAGSVTAALFLRRFVGDSDWLHFDIMAYNTRSRPGHPEGGEAMGLRAVLHYLEQRYGAAKRT